MAGNSITLFGSDPSTGANSYVQDAFSDITDTPSNNNGWSSTISSNPMNNFYGNDDSPRFGPKTLWIQDLVLEPNRNNWIANQPTYRIVWNEPFPCAQGYVFGDIQILRNGDQVAVLIKSSQTGVGGCGFGVGGVFRQCMALLSGNSKATAGSAAVNIDGVSNGVNVQFGNENNPQPNVSKMYFATLMSPGAEQAYNIHDFRLVPNQAGTLLVEGVIVYSENPSLSIDQFPGATYNNKSKSITTANSTLQIPNIGITTLQGASFGGVVTIWKNQSGGYSLSTLPHPFISSLIATGASGTNLVSVAPGTGASFSGGDGLYAISATGATPWLGLAISVSTDTITVSPTLPFGLSGSVYRYFQSGFGASYSMNSSLCVLAMTFGATEISRWLIYGGASNPVSQGQTGLFCYTDPTLRFYLWGSGLGMTVMNGYPALSIGATTTSWFQCEGYFSGADIEWVSAAGVTVVTGGSFSVNGQNGQGIGLNLATSIYRQTIMADAPTGWNSFAYSWGGNANTAVGRIGLWQRNRDISASFAILGKFDVLPQFIPSTTNATLVGRGVYQRVYADQFMMTGPWTRTVGVTIPGGVMYQGSGTSCALNFGYFGTNFALHGMSLGKGASISYSLDSSSNLGATSIGSAISAGSTFHSVSLSILGGTLSIWAIDVYRQYGEMKNLQTFSGVTAIAQNPIPIMTRWMPYTVGVTGIGPTSQSFAYWRRIGTDCEIKGVIFPTQTGAVNATLAIFLPPGLVADGTNTVPLPNTAANPAVGIPVGSYYIGNQTAIINQNIPTGVSFAAAFLMATPYAPYLTFWGAGLGGLIQLGSTGGFQAIAQGGGVGFQAKVAIAGWEIDH